jgi:alpha-galactosidase/6-phospho-beta-glucosidase family protein
VTAVAGTEAPAEPEEAPTRRRPLTVMLVCVLAVAALVNPAAGQPAVFEPTIAARLDLDQTAALLDELLEANAEHLPRFAAATR